MVEHYPFLPHRSNGFTYSKPTFSLTDYFFFDTHSAPDTLLMLVNRLSHTFLNDAFFRMQLETTDGDFHFNLDPGELKFMFHHRRDTLLMLYLDAATTDGQWISMRLSYHPLATGPNGETEITSHQADDILEMIHTLVGIEPEKRNIPARMTERFAFEPETFSCELLTGLFEEISRDYLHKIPPVAFFSTTDGSSYTGLSSYQLERILPIHKDEVAIISMGITKLITAQTLSLMFEFCPHEKVPTATLCINWGDTRKHDALWRLIRDRMSI
ncbi:MAG: hypothetical protein R3C61_06515 [Bacteroidia bacterium]